MNERINAGFDKCGLFPCICCLRIYMILNDKTNMLKGSDTRNYNGNPCKNRYKER